MTTNANTLSSTQPAVTAKKLTPEMLGKLTTELETNPPKRYEITEAARTLTELLVQLGDATVLDKVHITLKAHPEKLGALVIVSYARKDPGARKFFYASRFIADGENAYRALMLQRPKMIKRAISNAKRTIRASAH